MSRVGKNPVEIPSGVDVALKGTQISVKGKLGSMEFTFSDDVKLSQADNKVIIEPASETRNAKQMWGTARAIIQNMVTGVDKGFEKVLVLKGVGYRAVVKGNNLEMQLGYSHDVIVPIPEGLKVECTSPTELKVSGFSKEKVGQFSAEIKAWRPPEPYKGKGIRYKGEFVLSKEGKKK